MFRIDICSVRKLGTAYSCRDGIVYFFFWWRFFVVYLYVNVYINISVIYVLYKYVFVLVLDICILEFNYGIDNNDKI